MILQVRIRKKIFYFKNKTMKTKFILLSIIFLTAILPQGSSQGGQQSVNSLPGDSLSLQYIISEIIRQHPTVKSAEEALNNADARIGYARTGYNPNIDFGASYSNLGPVIKLTIPSMGTFQLFPENNYSAAVNLRQTVYDFGRTKQSIEIENRNRVYTEEAIEQVKQKMAVAAITNFYSLLFLQEAFIIKDEQLSDLNTHLDYVKKLKSTGAATDYQILSTNVRISEIESQKADILAAIKIQQAVLNSFLGQNDKNSPVVKKELYQDKILFTGDSLLPYALRNRDEMLLEKEKINIARLRYDLTRTQLRPIISAMASGGAKNGYVPDLNQIKPNYTVGVGLAVPIFDAGRTKYNLKMAESSIKTLNLETENTMRTISAEVTESIAYMDLAIQKMKQQELQLDQALKANELAGISFKSGVVTNLELLDANTNLSQSRLMLLKSRIDYEVSIYRLKSTLGIRLY
jgi:outer membrane protein